MNFENGKVYKILNTIDDDVYVGSTCQPLCKRMAKHRNYTADKSQCHRPLYVKMKLFGLDKFYIELIEECPCESKEQLRKREGHYIKLMGTLNVLMAGNTTKETNHNYYENNKEKHAQHSKEYYETHKEQIKQYNKEYHDKHKEETAAQQKQHYVENKEIILQRNKKYREQNQDKLKEWNVANSEKNKARCKEYRDKLKAKKLAETLNV